MGWGVGAFPTHGLLPRHPQPCPRGGWVRFGVCARRCVGAWGMRVPEGLRGPPLLRVEEDAEAEEEGAEQTLRGERGHRAGEGLAAQQGFIQAAVRGRWGPVAHVCLQGGAWNSLKQLFNYGTGCQESPVHTHMCPP